LEPDFGTFVKHLEAIIADLDHLLSVKRISEETKREVIRLLEAIMDHGEVLYMAVPDSLYRDVFAGDPSRLDSVTMYQSGVIVVKEKEGRSISLLLEDFPPSTFIKIINTLIPDIKKQIGDRRRTYEETLEKLQTIKESLAALGKQKAK